MNTTIKDMNKFAQKEITSIMMRLTKIEKSNAQQVSDNIVEAID